MAARSTWIEEELHRLQGGVAKIETARELAFQKAALSTWEELMGRRRAPTSRSSSGRNRRLPRRWLSPGKPKDQYNICLSSMKVLDLCRSRCGDLHGYNLFCMGDGSNPAFRVLLIGISRKPKR